MPPDTVQIAGPMQRWSEPQAFWYQPHPDEFIRRNTGCRDKYG